MNNYNEVKKSFGTQAEKFASYHMSKAEYTDYLIRSIQAKGNEHALEVAAGTCIGSSLINRESMPVHLLKAYHLLIFTKKKIVGIYNYTQNIWSGYRICLYQISEIQ